MAAIVGVAAFLRFWQLDAVPPGYHYDEAFEGLEAWKLLTQPGYHPIFFPGNFGVEPLFIYLTALAFRFFGAGPTVQRAVAALLGTLTVPALYALARELRRAEERLPRPFPLFSAAALAILYWHLHFSRVGIEPVLVPLLLVVAFWALWRGLCTGRFWDFAAAGFCLGLGPYAYPAGRLLLPLAVAFVVFLLIADRARLRGRWKGLTLTLLVALLVFVPLGVHFWRNPQLLTLRTSQVAVAGEGEGGVLANALRTLSMFSVAGDVNPRSNLPGRPALDWFIAVPFYLGIGVACWRMFAPRGGEQSAIRNPQSATCTEPSRSIRSPSGFVLLAGAVMLLPTVLSEYAPHFRRAIGGTPAVALLIGLGLASIVACGEKWKGGKRRKGGGISPGFLVYLSTCLLVSLSLLSSAFITTRDYFTHWANSPDLYYAFDVGLWEVAQYVNELSDEELVYVTPRPAEHTTLAFAWREGQRPEPAEGRRTRHFDGRHAFIAPARSPLAGRPATYVIIGQEDFRGGLLLRELYPGAQRVREFRDRDGRLYAEVFRIVNGGDLARAPQRARPAAWEEGISLVGYDLNAPVYHAGDMVYLQLWWAAEAQPARDWKVFTHLLGPPRADGSPVWAGRDAEPGQGSVPTSTWQPGELILDEYQLPLPAETPPGEYVLEMGLYEAASGETSASSVEPRAVVLVSPPDAPAAPQDQWQMADHVILGTVRVIGDQ